MTESYTCNDRILYMYDTDIMQVMQKNDARREKHAVGGMPTSDIDRLQLEERDTAVAYGEGDVDLARHLLLSLLGILHIQRAAIPDRNGTLNRHHCIRIDAQY